MGCHRDELALEGVERLFLAQRVFELCGLILDLRGAFVDQFLKMIAMGAQFGLGNVELPDMRLQHAFLFAQFRLDLLAFGDIAADDGNAGYLAGIVVDR